nr:reverse transcriptase domain-containing protein [Tanacetum cinerariifolium]
MIQQVQNSCQFHGLPGDDANKHLDKFLHVTQSIKVNGVTDDALRLYLFSHSLTHHATAWFDRLQRNSINTFEQIAKMFLEKYFPPFMVTKLRNEITNFRLCPNESLFKARERYKILTDRYHNHNILPEEPFMRVLQVNQQVKAVTPNCETCGGPHSFNDCPVTVGNTQNVYVAGAYQGIKETIILRGTTKEETNSSKELTKFIKMNTASSSGSRTLPGNTITNPKEDLKGITTQSGTAYQGPMIPTTASSLPPVVERETEATKDMVHLANNGSTKDNKLFLPNLSPTCLTLELTDHLSSHPVGVDEDVFVKVGKFHFSADFIVVDFNADPRVPLILERSFLKTGRALVDVFEANYNDMMTNRIDVINMACEEYSKEVLGFSEVIASGNPTPYYDPIVSTTSLTLTPFGNSDFLLEEVDAFLALKDDLTLSEVDQSYVDTEGDILLLESFLNYDPSLPPPNQGYYLPQVRKELKICEAKTNKFSIDGPSEVDLKDLPPHLEYVFLEGDDKLPVIIVNDLSVEEKTALIMVLKSHKRAIAWKLSYIKGIDPEFYTHKILMEEDFEPAVQHQRRVNPKIHDIIKNEVLKLLDVGLIYPISNSPWVSPVYCVPKKGDFNAVENEENEVILTRLVTGWRVCIDYRKLNEATRKDHFPLPFMDQMLERLAGNQYYFFLTVSLGISKFPSIQRIKRKPHSLVHTECFPTTACLLGYAMHRARFRGV